MLASTRGSPRSIGCTLIACSTASGSGVGPGEWRKRRPGKRVGAVMPPMVKPRSRVGASARFLVDERLHAIERACIHHVARHRAAGVVVGGGDAGFELPVEQGL